MGEELNPTKNGSGAQEKIEQNVCDVQQKKLPYPKAVFFIIGNEFCERFNYYGMRTILVIYLSRILLYSQNTSTVIYHAFTMFVYLFCIFGAFLSDSCLGKCRTIAYLSTVYAIGSVVISLGAIEPLHLTPVTMTLLGLGLIAIGSGGIKPCVAAFGGDQFKLPEQKKQMATFFSIFYFSINSGSLLSTTITPILRQDVHCFDNEHCFPLAFGVPAVLMVISITIFLLGRPLYVSKPPEGNTFALVAKAIKHGTATKFKEWKTNPKDHFLDYAIPQFGQQLVNDVKALLRILLLYLPLPIFWALYEQQGSRWTFQATMMNGNVGVLEIKPEQMQLANPLMILIMIPIYEYILYPLLAKVGIRRPLQKLTLGGVFAGLAFILSALLEMAIVPTHGIQTSEGYSQLRMFNTFPDCNFVFTTNKPRHDKFELKSLGYFEELDVDVSKNKSVDFISSSTGCAPITNSTLELESNTAVSYYLTGTPSHPFFKRYHDSTVKSEQGFAKIRILPFSRNAIGVNMHFQPKLNKRVDFNASELVSLQQGEYDLVINGNPVWSYNARSGDVITVLVAENSTVPPRYSIVPHRLAPENSVNLLWQLPQYFVLTLGEVMFSVTGLEFSYSQAPLSMKSVLQACWQLTMAIGNLIVVIVAEISLFKNQAHEYFLFAALMFLDMFVFMLLARKYKPNDPNACHENLDAKSGKEDSKKIGLQNLGFIDDYNKASLG